MKKFLCVFMLCAMVLSVPAVSFARSTAERIGENVLSNVLSSIIMDTIRRSGKGGSAPTTQNPEVNPTAKTKLPRPEKSKSGPGEKVTELSVEQCQSFAEICLAGYIEEFRKKIEYENISPNAKYIKEDGSEITLMEMAKASPNPELAEFLIAQGAEVSVEATASADVKAKGE